MKKEYFVDVPENPKFIVSPQAIKCGNTIYIAGQVARDADGNFVGKGDMRIQATRAFENLERVLKACGGSMKDVVKLVTYITDREKYPEVREVRTKRFLPEKTCCSTLIVAKGLSFPETLIELDAIAVLDD